MIMGLYQKSDQVRGQTPPEIASSKGVGPLGRIFDTAPARQDCDRMDLSGASDCTSQPTHD